MTKELQARLVKQNSPGKHRTEESLPTARTNVYMLSLLHVPLRYEYINLHECQIEKLSLKLASTL